MKAVNVLSKKLSSNKLVAFVGLAAVASFSQASTAAFASGDACSASNPDAITVGNNVCEITFLTTPSNDFVVPKGVSALQALLVGGGSGANVSYTGGGGEVKVVDLATTGNVKVTVATAADIAADGNLSKVTQNGTDSIAAGGVKHDDFGGAPGAGGPGGVDRGINGLGDLGANSNNNAVENGGDGIVVKNIAGASLFSDDNDCFGGGGAHSDYSSDGSDIIWAQVGIAVCGGGSTSVDVAADTYAAVAPIANSGGGAGGYVDWISGRAGSSGRVVLRYTLAEEAPTLANTGGFESNAALLFGSALVAAGALALKRRTSKN